MACDLVVEECRSVRRAATSVPPLSDIEFAAAHLPESRLRPATRSTAMHVEPLEKLPHSVREFLSHYAMIVLSILTALALEQAALGIEHRHEGARAKEEIEQEIASNRKAVEQALAQMRNIEAHWNGLVKRTVGEVRAGQASDDGLLATLNEAAHDFRDALPPIRTSAWDAAIADHSVNYLAHEDLTHYSEVYANQRLLGQATWDMMRDSSARDMSAISLAVDLGKPDPAATLATLNLHARTISIVVSQLSYLDAVLKGTPEAAEADHANVVASAPPASSTSR